MHTTNKKILSTIFGSLELDEIYELAEKCEKFNEKYMSESKFYIVDKENIENENF